MSLSREQKTQIEQLRNQYIDIFIKWEKNPTSFEHNISCLSDMKQVVIPYMQMLLPYINKANAQMDHRGLFHKLESMNTMRKCQSIATKIKDGLFNEDVTNLLKEVFGREPRITGLSANLNDNHHEKFHGNVMVLNETKHTETFEIKFSDNTSLTLHSLNDEQALAEAKEFFEEKMQSLQRPSPRLN
tara:strand:- start:52 stop:612 length:561 start_codon:yes stop_codon:yes gene_type:complete